MTLGIPYAVCACVGIIICIISMWRFSAQVRKSRLTALLFLLCFTIFYCILIGLSSKLYGGEEILVTKLLTSAIFLILFLYSLPSPDKGYFTITGSTRVFATSIVVGVILFCWIAHAWRNDLFQRTSDEGTKYFSWLKFFANLLTFVLLSAFLFQDTQNVIKGNTAFTFTTEEYVFAVINMYYDLIRITVHVLKWVVKKCRCR